MVKLAFELSLVCETREAEILESYGQGSEVSARRVKSLPWRKGVTSSVPLGRCVCRLELRRSSGEIDESKSDVINTLGVPYIQYIDRAIDIPVMRGRWCFSTITGGLCVFLKPVTSQASKLSWIYPWIGK